MLKDVLAREDLRELKFKNLLVILVYLITSGVALWLMFSTIKSIDLLSLPFVMAIAAGLLLFAPIAFVNFRRPQRPILQLAYLLWLSFWLPLFAAIAITDWPHFLMGPNLGRGVAGFLVLVSSYVLKFRDLIRPEIPGAATEKG